MVFEQHLVVGQLAKDFDLSGHMAHHVAHAFAGAVLELFGLFHDPVALGQGNLEVSAHAGHGTALENVIGCDAPTGQSLEQFSHGSAIVVDAF